jgi:hypothetical protein
MGSVIGPWGALAGGVIGGAAGWFFGSQAEEAKKKAALEQARRADAAHQEVLGEATALGGASGVEMGTGSLQLHLDSMAAEFRRQNEWNVQQAREGADLGNLTNDLNLASNLGSSLYRFGASKNWFGAAT